jgi:hypothetical protein
MNDVGINYYCIVLAAVSVDARGGGGDDNDTCDDDDKRWKLGNTMHTTAAYIRGCVTIIFDILLDK